MVGELPENCNSGDSVYTLQPTSLPCLEIHPLLLQRLATAVAGSLEYHAPRNRAAGERDPTV